MFCIQRDFLFKETYLYNVNSQILNGIFEVVWISTPEFKMASILKLKKYLDC